MAFAVRSTGSLARRDLGPGETPPRSAAVLLAAGAVEREIELAQDDPVVGGAAQLEPNRFATVAVTQLEGAGSIVVQPALAPLDQRDEHRQEVGTLGRQAVSMAGALPGLAVRLALQQPLT